MPHTVDTMHEHSLEAYRAASGYTFSRRAKEIWDFLAVAPKPLTARQIKDDLYGTHYDMNYVRPRLTELLAAGWVYEVGHAIEWGHRVMLVRARLPDSRAMWLASSATYEQGEMI